SSTVEHPDLFNAVSIDKDGHLAAPMFKGQSLKDGELCLTFENLLTKSPFVPLVRKVLAKVEAAYGRPVDIEFAWDDNKLHILQCRSLSTRREMEKVVIPENIPPERILFTTHVGLSNSIVPDLEYIVYVDPRAYDGLKTYEEKMKIASVVNLLNKDLSEKRFALLGPGRWGSNDINLGVRVSYANINKAKLLMEIAFARDGYTPEVSYGTHFFQDLVEADIVIVPLFPDDPGAIFNESFLINSQNVLKDVVPEAEDCEQVVRVIHVPSVCNGDSLQVYLDSLNRKGTGFFGPKEEGK
ncbi:MAG: pyruvate, phosphate dikinase, partial [Deltaproteobacteria bacterium]